MGISRPAAWSKPNTTAASAASSLRAWSTLISATARTSLVPLAMATSWRTYPPPPELTASARPLPDPPLREGRELGRALLDVAGHAFFEVVGLERGFHLPQGPLERVGEVGVEVEIDLGLDHRHRARRAV